LILSWALQQCSATALPVILRRKLDFHDYIFAADGAGLAAIKRPALYKLCSSFLSMLDISLPSIAILLWLSNSNPGVS